MTTFIIFKQIRLSDVRRVVLEDRKGYLTLLLTIDKVEMGTRFSISIDLLSFLHLFDRVQWLLDFVDSFFIMTNIIYLIWNSCTVLCRASKTTQPA